MLVRMPIEQRDGFRLWEGGPVPKGADGITLGSLVIVRSGHATPYLLRHEMVHVRQWRRYGVFGWKLLKYWYESMAYFTFSSKYCAPS